MLRELLRPARLPFASPAANRSPERSVPIALVSGGMVRPVARYQRNEARRVAVVAGCREVRQAAERARYAERRAAGICTRCEAPTFDGDARCGPCAVLENSRRSPEHKNAAARRSYERSDHFRGMPLYPPSYTVVALDTGADHGTWDSWEEVAMCLAFARLSLDQVEVLVDQSPMQTLTSW